MVRARYPIYSSVGSGPLRLGSFRFGLLSLLFVPVPLLFGGIFTMNRAMNFIWSAGHE